MSRLSRRERELVALGAALGSNCIPCVAYHIAESKLAGLTQEQIAEAVKLADTVRRVPAQQTLSAAHAHLDSDVASAGPCGCASATDC